MKKIYTYDYNQTIPNNKNPQVEPVSGNLYTNPPRSVNSTPPPQDINQNPNTSQAQASNPTPPYDTPTIPDYPNYDPQIQRSNFVPLAAGVIVVLILVAITWVIIPKTYEECVSFPGSKQANTFPPQCTTLYGASFRQSSTALDAGTEGPSLGTQEMGSLSDLGFGAEIPQISPAPTSTVAGTSTETQNAATTKGGQAVVTPAPTAKPTPAPTQAPTNTYSNPADGWTTHRYPTQHLKFDLPDNYNGTTAVRNLNTGITTFAVYTTEPKNPLIAYEVKQGWSGWEGAQKQAVIFMIGDTGVVSVTADQSTSYYFETDGWVFRATCQHLGNDGAKDLCQRILKSTQFI
jgi:hypothetical protein